MCLVPSAPPPPAIAPPPQMAVSPTAAAVRSTTVAQGQQQFGSTLLNGGLGDPLGSTKLGSKSVLGA